MSDGSQLNVMSGGDLIQTEDFGTSGKIQRIKLALGAKDADTGDVTASNPIPTNDSSLNTVQGTLADAAISTDTTGSISGKLRGLVKILADVWDSTNHWLKVDLQNATVAVTGTFWQSTQPVSLSSLPALAAGSNAIGSVNQGTSPWITQDQPQTSGGLTPYKLISAASTNATSLKASAGQIYSVQVFNLNASQRYLKFYNKASAPTVGTDTPVKVFMIPGNSTGAGIAINIDKGVTFGTGIAFAITGGITDTDTTAISANEVIVNIDYK